MVSNQDNALVSNLQDAILREKLRILHSRTLFSQVGAVLTALIAFGISDSKLLPLKLIWLFLLFATVVLRLFETARYRSLEDASRSPSPKLSLRRLRVSLAASSIVWGSVSFLLMPAGTDVVTQFYFIFIVSGVSSAAVISFAIEPFVVVFFLGLTVMPLLFNILYVQTGYMESALWAIVCYHAYTGYATLGSAKNLNESIRLRVKAGFDAARLNELNQNLLLRSTVLNLLGENRPLWEILHSMLRMIETQYPYMHCCVMLKSSKENVLSEIAAPSLPPQIKQLLERVDLDDETLPCAKTVNTGNTVLIHDLPVNVLTRSNQDIWQQQGLISCWSIPVLDRNQKVIASFDIYLEGSKFPSAVELDFLRDNAQLAGLALERSESEHDLRVSATAFEVDQGMMVTDAENRILRVNKAYSRLTGYSAEEVVGKTPPLLKTRRQDDAFYQKIKDGLALHQNWQGEIWDKRKDGELFLKWMNISAVTAANGMVLNYVASFADITKRMQAEQQIRQLAYYDPLTQLPNRRLLLDRLRQAVTSSERSQKNGALLFIDLDNFKVLNDTKGHDVGDLLLIEVSKRLAAAVRAADTVGRLGGDEFVVMLEDLSLDVGNASHQAEQVGEKILQALGEPYVFSGWEHRSTPSIGICIFGEGGQKVDEILKRADTAMYQAKAAGRNTLRFFDPAMQAALEERTILEVELHSAVAHDELVLHYQLQVDQNRQAVGAEALLRWQHPKRGLIMPVEFISLAEETGMIGAIGMWVLETACRQLKSWENAAVTRHLKIAVNVSARQFRQVDFVEQVTRLVEDMQINPKLLVLELTESLILDNVDDAVTKMQAIKPLGIGFSMDDFGTGQSSLTYLKRLPLNELKIDSSFVRDITTDANDAVIVQTIIGMARNLGLHVIAEGVEDEDQLAFLVKNDCFVFQGYLFGRPVAADEIMQNLL